MKTVLLFWCLACLCALSFSSSTLRPIIGVLDQPCGDDLLPYGRTYLPASYVKWIESSGGRVVPVSHASTKRELRHLFSSLNGILFTGGSLSLLPNTTYYQTAAYIYELALEAFEKGDYFPLWGTCQGFQLMCILASNDESSVQRYAFDSENLPLALDFAPQAQQSRMFGSAGSDIFSYFASWQLNITINLHHDGVDPALFQQGGELSSSFSLLASNVDRKGKPFASAYEGVNAPIYGVQFHPERNQFEWDTPELVSHSPQAIRAMQYLGDFFLNEARKNGHRFTDPSEEERRLIYQHTPMYTGNLSADSYPEQQTYVFQHAP